MTGRSFVGRERLFWKGLTINGLREHAVRMKVLAVDCIVDQGLILVWVFSTMGNCSSAHFMFCSYSCVYRCFY
jgi:hypothetical protein